MLGRFWRPDWAAVAAAHRDRRADLGLDACSNGACSPRPRSWWAGSARRRSPRIRSRCRSSTDHFHGAVRHLARGDRARRPRGRPPRFGGDAARGLQRDRTGRRLHDGDDGARRACSATPSRSLFLGSDAAAHAETATLAGSLLLIGATLLHHRRHAGDRGRRVARPERHARAARCSRRVSFWLIGFTSAYWLAFHVGTRRVSASGSASRSASPALRGAADLALPHGSPARHYHVPALRLATTWSNSLTITELGHRGEGIADTSAGPVFVPYTLPGETVEVERLARPSRSPPSAARRCRERRAHRADLSAFRHLRRLRAAALEHRSAIATGSAALVVEALRAGRARCAGR